MKEDEKLRPIILIFSIITFFVFVVSFTIFYTTENFSSVCGCKLPLWVILVSISSLGLFVGLISYYIISNNFLREKKQRDKNIFSILNYFDDEEKIIIEKIIEKKGEINQSYLSKELNFDKVKLSRIISRMEKKGMIRKKKNGMTNKIVISKDLSELFIE